MIKRGVIAAFTLLLVFFLSSCRKDIQLPDVPVIGFEQFKQFGSDSALVSISFQDGKGDIGLSESDINPPFNGGIYQYNFYMEYYYKDVNGNWNAFNTSNQSVFDTLRFKYRIFPVIPEGTQRVAEGTIQVHMDNPYFIPGHTAFKYKIWVYDRGLHKSNVVETREIHP